MPNYRVNVLGCYLPMPSHYILNASSSRSYYFYDGSDDGFGSIDIGKYDEKGLQNLLDLSELLGQEEKEGRVAMLISSHLENAPSGGFPSAILHDYDRMVTIHGDEVPNWQAIFDACIATPSPKKPPNYVEIEKMIRDTMPER